MFDKSCLRACLPVDYYKKFDIKNDILMKLYNLKKNRIIYGWITENCWHETKTNNSRKKKLFRNLNRVLFCWKLAKSVAYKVSFSTIEIVGRFGMDHTFSLLAWSNNSWVYFRPVEYGKNKFDVSFFYFLVNFGWIFLFQSSGIHWARFEIV